eukprot:Tbor_TRINITY_DN4273_c0_g1::TRINITY_DN4273_c0_g1_i1::g.23956::m.23956
MDDIPDTIVLGEFSEQTGPCIINSFVDRTPEVVPVTSDVHDFMMRAMAADFVYNPDHIHKSVGRLKYRQCEVLMDRVRWRYAGDNRVRLMTAFVYSFQIWDVFARAYTRNICISYLSPDMHKMFRTLPWIMYELEEIAKQIYTKTLQLHKKEVLEAYRALEFCQKHADRLTLTERHLGSTGDEFTAIKTRLRQLRDMPLSAPGNGHDLDASKDTYILDGESISDIHVRMTIAELEKEFGVMQLSDKRAVDIMNTLTTKKGTVQLRPIQALYSLFDCDRSQENSKETYSRWCEEVESDFRRAINTLPQKPIWLAEDLLNTLTPLPNLIGLTFRDIFGKSQSRFHLKIGQYCPTDPALEQWRNPDGAVSSEANELGLWSSKDMYRKMALFGAEVVLNVAFNALRGTTVIVCADVDSQSLVIEAMRVALTFVPGLSQSSTFYQAGVIPFDKPGPIKTEHIVRNSVIGCPTECALADLGNGSTVPLLTNVFVWQLKRYSDEISKGGPIGYFVQSILYGPRYGGDLYVGIPPIHDQKRPSVPPLVPQFSNSTEDAMLLDELFHLLREPSLMDRDPEFTAPYLRLTINKILTELSTMAALVMHTLRKEAKDSNYTNVPFALTEAMALDCLQTSGYTIVHPDDLFIVVCLAKRGLLLSIEKVNHC